MNPVIAIIAMVNGMIGGVILVLPLLALEAGTLVTFFVILVTGMFSFYSCYLCVLHLGNHQDLDKALLQHFNQSIHNTTELLLKLVKRCSSSFIIMKSGRNLFYKSAVIDK